MYETRFIPYKFAVSTIPVIDLGQWMEVLAQHEIMKLVNGSHNPKYIISQIMSTIIDHVRWLYTLYSTMNANYDHTHTG